MNADLAASQGNALDAAVQWTEAILVGSLASTIAIICVAWLGFMLIAGRLPTRRAVQLILGCFIIFGAPSIASGILHTLNLAEGNASQASPLQPVPIAAMPIAMPARVPSAPYDPYAGAALPPRR